jgi:tetratricopeptide (TPR) repeat protein
MMWTRHSITGIVMAFAAIAANSVGADSVAELLEKGIYAEETLGDLGAAIKIYQRISSSADAERSLHAQAIYRLGACHLKTGDRDEAARAFQRLLQKYPEHKGLLGKLPKGAIAPRRAVAVIGFKNLSGRTETAWISTALADLLTAELAMEPTLRAVSGEAIAEMKVVLALGDADSLPPETLARIRTHLRTEIVVVGSYIAPDNAGGGRVRIDVRAQDANAHTIASVTETGPDRDVIEILGRTATRLRTSLATTAPSSVHTMATAPPRPENMTAARHYAEGLRQFRALEARSAKDLLEKAVIADPTFARAYIALSQAWTALGDDERSIDAARRAVALSLHLAAEARLAAEACFAEAIRDDDKAIEAYQTLFALFPDQAEYGLRLGDINLRLGRLDDARSVLQALKNGGDAHDDPRISLFEAEIALRDAPNTARPLVAAARRSAERDGLAQVAARASVIESSIAYMTDGDLTASKAALEHARGIYAGTGYRVRLAEVLLSIAARANANYKLTEAEAITGEALSIFTELAQQRGREQAMRQLGAIYRRQGRLRLALEMFRRTAQVAAGATPEAKLERQRFQCWVLYELGEIEAARRLYDELAVDEKYIHVADGLVPYALVMHEQGDLEHARKLLEDVVQSLDAREVSQQFWARGALADILRDMDDAEGALQMQKTVPGALPRRRGHLLLLNDRGDFSDVERFAETGARTFEQARAADYVLALAAIRLQALLRLSKTESADEEARRVANLVATTENVLVKLAAQTVLALYEAARGRIDAAQRDIAGVVAEAAQRGCVAKWLDARLAQATIALQGDAEHSTQLLDALARDADAKGFRRISRETRTLAAQRRPRIVP